WIWRLPDPPRGVRDGDDVSVAASGGMALGAQPGSWAVYVRLLRQSPYLLTVLGYAAYTFAVGGLAVWMPTFLEQVRGVSTAQATEGSGRSWSSPDSWGRSWADGWGTTG
ncbi:membrane protein, partial [mine drainage metagenome]